MVNTGKPSTGCHLCRERHIKCDEKKPQCLRCQKSRRICPGYRTEQQIQRFRKVSAVRKRGERSNKKHEVSFDELIDHVILTSESPPHSNGGEDSSGEGSSTTAVIKNPPRKPSLVNFTISMDEQTTCFFATDYILVPGSSARVGFQDFVFHFSNNEKPGSVFQLALSATSLAGYSHRFKKRNLLPKAHQQYIECVQSINKSVVDRRAAWDDSILASVLLLTIFEQVTFQEISLNAWSSHVEGAVALVKFRGAQSFGTPIGRKLFNGTIRYMASGKAIDRSIDWFAHAGDDDFERIYACFNMRVVDLRAENNKLMVPGPRNADRIADVEEFLLRTKSLEEEYREWFLSLPSPYSTMAWIDNIPNSSQSNLKTSIAHPGRVDKYKELYLAYQYNVCRSSQILIWTLILRCTAYLRSYTVDYSTSPEYSDASRICRGLIQDIVSSVPYCFLWDQDDSAIGIYNIRSDCENAPVMKGVSAIYMMWPLHVAGNSDFATASQRLFLKGKMAYIAERVGISQAGFILQMSMPHPSTLIAFDGGKLPRPSPGS